MLILIMPSPHLRRLHSLIGTLDCRISLENEGTHRYTVLDTQLCENIRVPFGSGAKSLLALRDKQQKKRPWHAFIMTDNRALKLNPLIAQCK